MERVESYQGVGQSNDKTVSILQAFHTWLPADGRAIFLQHLQSLHTDQELYDHAQSLMTGLVAPLRSLRSTPTMSPRQGMDDSIENIASESTGPENRTPRLKEQCLERDGKKCVVTNIFDRNSLDPLERSRTDRRVATVKTECVHIIPFALASWHSDREEREKNIIWPHLTRYFPAIQRMNFTRANINDTKNAMTMFSYLHSLFGAFDFSFEATRGSNRYRIQIYATDDAYLQSLPRFVTFKAHDARYNLPSPELLNIHATIARIFHASGAAEQIEKALRDLGSQRVLARDGSTDISSMLAVSTLDVLSSRAGNVQQTHTASPDCKASGQSFRKNTPKVERPPDEEHTTSEQHNY